MMELVSRAKIKGRSHCMRIDAVLIYPIDRVFTFYGGGQRSRVLSMCVSVGVSLCHPCQHVTQVGTT